VRTRLSSGRVRTALVETRTVRGPSVLVAMMRILSPTSYGYEGGRGVLRMGCPAVCKAVLSRYRRFGGVGSGGSDYHRRTALKMGVCASVCAGGPTKKTVVNSMRVGCDQRNGLLSRGSKTRSMARGESLSSSSRVTRGTAVEEERQVNIYRGGVGRQERQRESAGWRPWGPSNRGSDNELLRRPQQPTQCTTASPSDAAHPAPAVPTGLPTRYRDTKIQTGLIWRRQLWPWPCALHHILDEISSCIVSVVVSGAAPGSWLDPEFIPNCYQTDVIR
jgi:hypothetical protein